MGDDPKTEEHGARPARLKELLEVMPDLQAQLDWLVENRLARYRRRHGDAEKVAADLERELARLRDDLAELEQARRERGQADEKNAKLAADVDAWKSRYARAVAAQRIGAQLDAAGVVRGAREFVIDHCLAKSQVAMGDDGQVNLTIGEQPLEQAVPALLAERPDLLSSPAGGGAGSGGSSVAPTGSTGAAATLEQVLTARRQGQLAEKLRDPQFARQAHQALRDRLGVSGGSPFQKKE